MTMRTALGPALLGAALALSPMVASAQSATAPAPQQPAQQSAAQQPQQPAGPTLAATYRDWQILCNTVDAAGTQNCEMYQLLNDANGSPIAEISIAALPFGSQFAAGATVTTPLETFLPTGVGFRIGDATDMRIEAFRVCTVVGCIVRMGLSPDEVDQMKSGSTATLTIAPFVAVDHPVDITVSLAGFTAAYDDLQTRLSEAAAAARANAAAAPQAPATQAPAAQAPSQ